MIIWKYSKHAKERIIIWKFILSFVEACSCGFGRQASLMAW
jgi:hypothetical protein